MKIPFVFNNVILLGMLCLLEPLSLFADWDNQNNNALRETPPVYFRGIFDKDDFVAFYENMKPVNIEGQSVQLVFSSRWASDFRPCELNRENYKFVGLNKQGAADKIIIKSRAFKHADVGEVNFIKGGQASTTVETTSGARYEIGVSFIADTKAIWMLCLPISGNEDATAYFVGIDYVKELP